MPQSPPQLSNAPKPRRREAVDELQRLLSASPDACRFSLLVIDESGRATLQQFTSQIDWVRGAADYVGRDVHVFPFVGVHVPYSEPDPPPAPQFRYLLVPGNPLPLFAMPAQLAPAQGDLGQQYAQLTRVNSLQGDAIVEHVAAPDAADEPPTPATPDGDVGPSVF